MITEPDRIKAEQAVAELADQECSLRKPDAFPDGPWKVPVPVQVVIDLTEQVKNLTSEVETLRKDKAALTKECIELLKDSQALAGCARAACTAITRHLALLPLDDAVKVQLGAAASEIANSVNAIMDFQDKHSGKALQQKPL